MGNRRNKNKAKRALVGVSKHVNSLQQRNKENLLKMSNVNAQKQVVENSSYDPDVTVQVTEMQKIDNPVTENDLAESQNQVIVQKKSEKAKLRKSDKVKCEISVGKENDVKSPDVLIYPTEVDGETCIDVECGANEAVMYLSRLCVGSKGACINFSDSWFTPNEFQLLSGRETAKDWKRSIRHKGRSLKLLICKGLIQIKSAMPKKSPVKFDLYNNRGHTETNVDAIKETNVAEENVLHDVPKTLCNIPKPKRGRKPKTQRPGKKTRSKANAYFVADDVHIVVDGTEHDNSNTVELPTSLTVDTRTDEERRLDEFVKSLRLTKTTAPTSAVSSRNIGSEHLAKEENVPVEFVTNDDEPEMPILQKEADVFPLTPSCNGEQSKLLVAVHATVTPPPTPPSQQADTEQKILDDRLVGTFKSHLTSPSVGLKLRINREKVKQNADFDEIPSTSIIEPKIQSILLQDALQSAKKYKEQLHQNKYQSPNKAVIQVPHIDSNFKPEDSNYFKELKDVRCSALDQKNEEAVRFQFSSSKSSSTATLPIASSSETNNRATNVSSTVLTDNDKSGITEHVKDINVSNDIKNELGNNKQFHPKDMPQPFHNFVQNARKIEDVRNLNGMNFNEFMALMTSAYGPLPFSADNRDAARAFATLQDRHRNHDMFNFTNQGHPEGTSPLLYPMITQQFLLAMTQQLYRLCNVSNGMPQQLPNMVPQMLRTSSPLPRSSSQKSKETTSKREVNNKVNQPDDLSRNKRKQSDIGSDCALDLSTKKPRVETKNIVKQVNVPLSDGPLDFSIKKLNMSESNMVSSHDQRYIDLNGYTYLNRVSDYSKGSSYSDHVPVTVNNYTNTYKPNEIHSHLLPYDINGVSKRISPSCHCSGTGIVNDDITSWSVERVCYFLKSLDGCGQYAKTFHDQGITGRLLPYLTTQHLTRTLGMKVGPALTLMQAVERKFREQRLSSTQSPCTYCRSYPQLVMPLLMLP